MKIPSTFCLRLLATGMLAASTGCLGLNIPSGRYHDPSPAAAGRTTPDGPRRLDHALLFANPRVPPETSGAWEEHDPTACGSRLPAGGSRGQEDDLPAVPWPRFHPVPTAPVFAPRPGP